VHPGVPSLFDRFGQFDNEAGCRRPIATDYALPLIVYPGVDVSIR